MTQVRVLVHGENRFRLDRVVRQEAVVQAVLRRFHHLQRTSVEHTDSLLLAADK